MAKADISRMEVVGSSNIVSAGWCPTRFCVDIEFKGGAVYRYHDVSAKVWEDFKAAPSKGQFVHSVLKKQECERLETKTREEAEGHVDGIEV